MLQVNEVTEWIQKRISGLSEEEIRFVIEFGLKCGDKDLTGGLIEEIKTGDRDFETIKKRYTAVAGRKPEWVEEAESLIASLEIYRIQEEKALNSLEEILKAYGVNVSRNDIESGNLDEVREKVREHEYERR